MKRFRRFEVTFKKIYRPGFEKTLEEETEGTPVEDITITLWAEDVNKAITLGWQTVVVNPQDYEIFDVHVSDGYGWRAIKGN